MPRKKKEDMMPFEDIQLNNFLSACLCRKVDDWKKEISEKETIKKIVLLDVYFFNVFPKDDFIKDLFAMTSELVSYYDRAIGFKKDDFYTEALEKKKGMRKDEISAIVEDLRQKLDGIILEYKSK